MGSQTVAFLPGFFAKELVQDLIDTPVFEGGREKACDQ